MIDSFRNYIEGKSIAIVGPAEYMTSSGLGLDIDSHDIVVRINRSIELCDDYKDDIGQKTDVLYSCLIEKSANAGKINPNELKKKGIKYICVPPKSSIKGFAKDNTISDYASIKKLSMLSNLFSTRIIDYKLNNSIAEKIMCRPNTGYLAIFDILNCNPEQLSIYGFSFYLDGFMKGCKSGVEKEENMTEAQYTDKCFNSTRHIQKNMWLYAKKTLLNHKKVKLDDNLKLILSLDRFDRNDYNKKRRK